MARPKRFELVQIDALSTWLENCGPEFTLLADIEVAASKIMYGVRTVRLEVWLSTRDERPRRELWTTDRVVL